MIRPPPRSALFPSTTLFRSTLTQTDINAGQKVNTATDTGPPPTGASITPTATTTTTLAPAPSSTRYKTHGTPATDPRAVPPPPTPPPSSPPPNPTHLPLHRI